MNLTLALHLPAWWRHCRWEELWRFPQVPWFEGKISSGKKRPMFVPLFFLGKPAIFATTKGHKKLHSCFLLFLLCCWFWLCLMFLSVWKLWMETPPKKHQKREIWESYRVDNFQGFSMFMMSSLFSHVFFSCFDPQVTQGVAPFWKTPRILRHLRRGLDTDGSGHVTNQVCRVDLLGMLGMMGWFAWRIHGKMVYLDTWIVVF